MNLFWLHSFQDGSFVVGETCGDHLDEVGTEKEVNSQYQFLETVNFLIFC